MKIFFALTIGLLLSTVTYVQAAELDTNDKKDVVTFCRCLKSAEATWWWPAHDLILHVVATETGKTTLYHLEDAFDSIAECKEALYKNPACRKN